MKFILDLAQLSARKKHEPCHKKEKHEKKKMSTNVKTKCCVSESLYTIGFVRS